MANKEKARKAPTKKGGKDKHKEQNVANSGSLGVSTGGSMVVLFSLLCFVYVPVFLKRWGLGQK